MFKEKGFSQTMLIIGIVLILAVGSIILLDVHRDRVMEEKIEELRQQVRPQQPGLLEQQEQVPIPFVEPTPEEIAQWEQEIRRRQEERGRFHEDFQPDIVLEILASGNMRTETFRLEDDPRISLQWSFYLFAKSLPDPDKPPFHKISLYRVGEEMPVQNFEEQWTEDTFLMFQEFVQEVEWIPATSESIAAYKRDWQRHWPPGEIQGQIFGGMMNADIVEPGEYYFVIETRNIDKWFLGVVTSISPMH